MSNGPPIIDFHKLMVDVLKECETHGMVKPLIVCVVSPNGSILGMRVSGAGIDPDVLADHADGKGFEPPLTIMVVDQTNYSFRITVNRHGGYVAQKQLQMGAGPGEWTSAPGSSAGCDP